MTSIIKTVTGKWRQVAFVSLALAVLVPTVALATVDDGVGNNATAASNTTLVQPCALFDTRGASLDDTTRTKFDQNSDDIEDGKPAGGTTLSFYARTGNGDAINPSPGTTEFNSSATGEYSQGGTPGCDVPDTATGVFINMVAIQPTFNGNLAAFEAGLTETPGGVLVFNTNQNSANAVYVALDNPADDPDPDLKVFINGSGSVHVRGVLLGYTTPEV